MACESEGALEIYLEPMLPAPQLVVIGRSPAVFTLTRLAGRPRLERHGDRPGRPARATTRTRSSCGPTLDLSGLGIGPGSAVVVATQGTYDDLALEAALATDAGYIGLVAAEKRASATLAPAARPGRRPTSSWRRVRAPAGLDLGPVDNAEIAVAVLAELVARRAAGRCRRRRRPVERREAIDPVCGMTVLVERVAATTSSTTAPSYWFCAPGCLAAFARDPAAYLTT